MSCAAAFLQPGDSDTEPHAVVVVRPHATRTARTGRARTSVYSRARALGAMLLPEAVAVIALSAALVPCVRYAVSACGRLLQMALLYVAALTIAIACVGMVARTEAYQAARASAVAEYRANATRKFLEGVRAGVGIFQAAPGP